MTKDAGAYRTIGEVADALGLPQHVLRYWESRFSQLSPLKRAGGRRYYRPEEVALLATIKRLVQDEGYTLKGVQRALRGGARIAALQDLTEAGPETGAAPPGTDVLQDDSPGEVTRRSNLQVELATELDACARILAEARNAAAPDPG